jgi:hypothetical protein
MAPIYSLKKRRPSGDGAPSISIAFRREKIVRATPARRDAVPLIGRQAPDKGGASRTRGPGLARGDQQR